MKSWTENFVDYYRMFLQLITLAHEKVKQILSSLAHTQTHTHTHTNKDNYH